VESEAVSKIAHDVVSVCPETDDEGSTSIAENPDWNRGLRRELAGVPDEVDGGERTDGTVLVSGRRWEIE
jgi:hypothetical protein